MVFLESSDPPEYIYKSSESDIRLKVNLQDCISCMACLSECPTEALWENQDDELVFFPNQCDLSGRCAEVCPTYALELIVPEDEEQCNFDEATAGPCAEMLDINTTGGGDTFPRVYKWKIYKNVFDMWHYQSTEVATIKKVLKNGEYENQYVSLVHSGVDLVGQMVFVTGAMSVIAAPTVGTYNSVMEISGVFSLHLVCKGVPAVSSTSFSVHMAFTAND